MKRIIPLLIIYVLVHSTDGDSVRAYDGQSQATITSLLTDSGKTGDFITRTAYNAFIVAHTPAEPTPAQILSFQRVDALNYLDSPQGSSKAERGLILVLIDELNVLRGRDRDRTADIAVSSSLADLKTRWAARSTLADRDITQVKPAIQNKISSGSAD